MGGVLPVLFPLIPHPSSLIPLIVTSGSLQKFTAFTFPTTSFRFHTQHQLLTSMKGAASEGRRETEGRGTWETHTNSRRAYREDERCILGDLETLYVTPHPVPLSFLLFPPSFPLFVPLQRRPEDIINVFLFSLLFLSFFFFLSFSFYLFLSLTGDTM